MKKLIWLLLPLALIVGYVTREKAVVPISQVVSMGTSTTALPTQTQTPVSLSIFPSSIQQGEPAEIVINNIDATDIKSLTFNGKSVGVFMYNSKPTGFIGIDLKMAPGTYPLILTLTDGKTAKKDLIVRKRAIAEAPLGIPDKLGGNTSASEAALVATLARENAILAAVPTASTMLWSGPFVLPLHTAIVVTDPYGYTRLTGLSTISHKGTDFRAAEGTPVYAMNAGTVKVAETFVEYGNTVVIDHGLGLQTLYMHLSKIEVSVGETVEKGQEIGKSGQTGYAEAPHLHISVKIGGISIDPEKFLELFR